MRRDGKEEVLVRRAFWRKSRNPSSGIAMLGKAVERVLTDFDRYIEANRGLSSGRD
jgi:hypothetical protein